jgi:hypothetical protein
MMFNFIWMFSYYEFIMHVFINKQIVWNIFLLFTLVCKKHRKNYNKAIETTSVDMMMVLCTCSICSLIMMIYTFVIYYFVVHCHWQVFGVKGKYTYRELRSKKKNIKNSQLWVGFFWLKLESMYMNMLEVFSFVLSRELFRSIYSYFCVYFNQGFFMKQQLNW